MCTCDASQFSLRLLGRQKAVHEANTMNGTLRTWKRLVEVLRRMNAQPFPLILLPCLVSWSAEASLMNWMCRNAATTACGEEY